MARDAVKEVSEAEVDGLSSCGRITWLNDLFSSASVFTESGLRGSHGTAELNALDLIWRNSPFEKVGVFLSILNFHTLPRHITFDTAAGEIYINKTGEQSSLIPAFAAS